MSFRAPSFDLKGRVAVVTGGNGGIGRAIALGLASAGASVAILARNADKTADVLAELRSASSATSSLMLTRCLSAVFDSSTSPRTKEGSTSVVFANAAAERARASLPNIVLRPDTTVTRESPMPYSARPIPYQAYGQLGSRSMAHWNSEAASS